MPDAHAGAGAVIGFTSTLGSKIIPNIVGVDIGCGVLAFNIGKRNDLKIDFEKVDSFIKENIPFGMNVRNNAVKDFITSFSMDKVKKICNDQGQDYERVLKSLGTLGSGNHFIEIDIDEEDDYWILIHTGSRNFGLKIANYYQSIAKSKCGKMGGLEFLEGEDANNYLHDMYIAQMYASDNRRLIGYLFLKKFLGILYGDIVESVHNYIKMNDKIIRKGAISAYSGEKVIIPLNMRDGAIIGIGKGNKEWNFSAPHGAGRILSRSKAKETVSLDDFKETMKGIWSSCIGKGTLDESPFVYKDANSIIELIDETVLIQKRLKPVYNFKAGE
jgi:RNA-splicing ligase RtcB